MTGFVFIYITCRDKEEAEKIGRHLVEKKLAACINIFPEMHSVYWWEGKVESAEEAVLVVKTSKKLADKVTEEVRKLHSYSVPCVIALPVVSGNPDYLKWIGESVS
jgi:periplasmic divalent cation tolerance protein